VKPYRGLWDSWLPEKVPSNDEFNRVAVAFEICAMELCGPGNEGRHCTSLSQKTNAQILKVESRNYSAAANLRLELIQKSTGNFLACIGQCSHMFRLTSQDFL
jgi:hypothetical protein